jgi:HD superfamily phosphohydrolase
MTRVLDRLRESHRLEAADITAACCAAVLHDTGHGPFSHVMEKVWGFHHETWTTRIVTSEETQVGRLLAAYDSQLPRQVADIIEGRFHPRALAHLVSSQLDVDRMDYLLRDSLMTGAKYGIYDLEWILNSLAIDEDGERLYVQARGLYAVEEYLQARYYMFRQVYYHRTLRSAEAVLRGILRRALELTQTGAEVWCAPGTAFERMLRRQELTLDDYLEMDDSDILFHVKQWQRASDTILRDLSRRFVERRLFKAVDLDMPQAERAGFISDAREIVRRAGFDAAYYFAEDEARDATGAYYSTEGIEPQARIYVEDGYARPMIRPINEVSDIARGLGRGYEVHRVCFPPEVKAEIYKLYHRAAPEDARSSNALARG